MNSIEDHKKTTGQTWIDFYISIIKVSVTPVGISTNKIVRKLKVGTFIFLANSWNTEKVKLFSQLLK